MRKYIFIFSLIGVLLFSACSAGGSGDGTTQAESTPRLAEDYSDALPVEEQLIVGTFNLEETDLAVDEAQAKTLLPLWQALQSLENSDTTAAPELTAVINQIQDNMTADQLQTIAAMKLTADDIQSAMQNAGAAFGFRGGVFNSDGTSNGEATGGFGFRGGGPPDGIVIEGSPGGGFGGPPGGGFFGGAGGGFGGGADANTIATRQAQFASGDSGGQTGSFLIDPLITLLEIRAGEREAPQPGEGGFFRGGFMGQVMDAVTAETGLTAEEIQAQMADGSTLAEIIEANGGDVSTVKASLAESLADIQLTEGQTLDTVIDNILNATQQAPQQEATPQTTPEESTQ